MGHITATMIIDPAVHIRVSWLQFRRTVPVASVAGAVALV
jgi:hypothetical protein